MDDLPLEVVAYPCVTRPLASCEHAFEACAVDTRSRKVRVTVQ